MIKYPIEDKAVNWEEAMEYCTKHNYEMLSNDEILKLSQDVLKYKKLAYWTATGSMYQPLFHKVISSNLYDKIYLVVKEKTAPHFSHTKTRWHLLPMKTIELLVDAYEEGVKNHHEDSWKIGFPEYELYNKAMRHLVDWKDVSLKSEDSNLHHLVSAAWNIITLLYQMQHPEKYGHLRQREYDEK